MSYDISRIAYIGKGRLSIDPEVRAILAKKIGQPANGSFLNDSCAVKPTRNGMLEIVHPCWDGEGSGHTFSNLVTILTADIMGNADLLVIWEGGDSISGLRVADGVVSEMDVEFSLVPRT